MTRRGDSILQKEHCPSWQKFQISRLNIMVRTVKIILGRSISIWLLVCRFHLPTHILNNNPLQLLQVIYLNYESYKTRVHVLHKLNISMIIYNHSQTKAIMQILWVVAKFKITANIITGVNTHTSLNISLDVRSVFITSDAHWSLYQLWWLQLIPYRVLVPNCSQSNWTYWCSCSARFWPLFNPLNYCLFYAAFILYPWNTFK